MPFDAAIHNGPVASTLFLRTAAVAALVGMALGLGMGMGHDFTLVAAHVHINLVGWTSMGLFGLFYRILPQADGRLARWHYGIATAGLLSMAVGLVRMKLGYADGEPTTVVGSLLTFASMAVFTWVVFGVTRRRKSTAAAPAEAPAA